MQAGLPSEGSLAGEVRAGSVCRADVPTCRLGDPLEDVRERAGAAGWDVTVVTTEGGVVLGLLRPGDLAGARGRAEDAMLEAPSTFRANVPIVELAGHMVEHDFELAPITRPEGTLIGLLRKDDAVAAALKVHQAEHDPDDDA
ncbi:MAG TPA: CBS domain-containing protein [Actinomycetota bacterium]|nr:CBS domain-containing protein [Actinomycetota bacterium]